MRIHLSSPDRVAFHRLANQSSRKNDDAWNSTDRSKSQQSDDHDNTSCVQFEARNEGRDCQEALVDGYVVDFGLVKAFPSEPDAECLPEPRHDTDQEGRTGTASESHIPQLRVMRIFATIVIVIILVAGLVVVFLVTLTTALLPPSRQVSLQPVDWFQQAMWLELGLMSTARITLLGEAEREQPG
ncbi:hypothetical protein FDECE_6737 [Fusarium decemcellulare]|nr:hypothetical protein FDECE_6737 [Fusarium decemcellulare]